MKKTIKMNTFSAKSVAEVFEDFVLSQTAKNLSETTIQTYHAHIHSISKHLDIQKSIDALTKKDLEAMVVSMRRAGLAHNSISSYCRVLRTFLNWCNAEGFNAPPLPNIKDKETLKETYTDEELEALLKRPKKNASFCEFRNWVIVCFLMNSGCRASSIRNMPLRYKIDVLAALKEKGYNTNKIRTEGLLSQSTLQKFRNKQGVSWENLETLCTLLDCQPADIIEFVKEPTVQE